MPDPTTNYGWNPPNNGGDSNNWGNILNTLIDDVDADLKTVDNAAVAAQASADLALDELIETKLIAAWEGKIIPSASTSYWSTEQAQWGTTATAVFFTSDGTYKVALLLVPLPDLRVGQIITAFSSTGWRTSSENATVSLVYVDENGSETTVSSGHTLPPSVMATTTTSGLSHTVLAGKRYYLRLDLTTASTAVGFQVRSFSVSRSR